MAHILGTSITINRVRSRVRLTIIDHLGLNDDFKVTDHTSFNGNLDCDSLDLVELIMAFEDEFGIEINDEDAESVLTVGRAVKLIYDAVKP